MNDLHVFQFSPPSPVLAVPTAKSRLFWHSVTGLMRLSWSNEIIIDARV